ncbi:hypothetical protein AXF42_Ash018112 [Apostasia shenzhenica]|uniref:DNA-directed RNA polymerase III subunit RPC5 n=1 Tax=Apostasia shenzhenica TaxID=1088818 RepID=A0A2I0AEX6_9ASPA|nr:hypothetical protein AXF42_Ash018112 [Apostasia shenzhenica]
MVMDSENYDQDVREPLKLRKQTLSSSEVASGFQYAIGVLLRNQLHLIPVHTVLQLRPSLAHLNDDACLLDMKLDSESTQVGKHMEDRLASRHPNENSVDEPWVLMQFYSKDSCTSSEYMKNMVKEMHRDVQFTMKPFAYLHSLSSGYLDYKKGGRVPLIRSLLGMPLEARLKKWFSEVSQVNRFDTLIHLIHGHSEDDLLKVLHPLAYLVQGVWVCKSSVLCSGDEAIQRDFILLLFTKANTISHRKLKELKLNPVALNSLLSGLAYNREILGDWKFKEPADLSFIKRYPRVVQEQRDAWSSLEKLTLESIHKLVKKIPQTARASPALNVKRTSTRKVEPVTNKSRDVKGSSAVQTMSSETREHLPKALLEIFNAQKVRSVASIRRGLREMALYRSSRPKEDPRSELLIKAASNGASASEHDLLSVIGQVTVDIHGAYVLKSSGNPVLDPLRDVVINLFRGKQPNSKLRKQEIKTALQSSLKREITDSECNQVVNELCISSKGELELKSGE